MSLKLFALLAWISLGIFEGVAAQNDVGAADCTAPLVTGNCKAAFRRWGSKDGKCEEFIYGGCGGNSNNFRSSKECEESCPSTALAAECDLPLEVGPCRASKPVWGFKNGKCRQFTYGGCRGNDNRFNSKKACQKRCVVTTATDKVKPKKCKNSLEKGVTCLTGKIRWLYNKATNACEETKKKTCSPSGNKKFGFNSRKQCERQCKD